LWPTLQSWAHRDVFVTQPRAPRVMLCAAPPSKKVSPAVWHPVFAVDQQGRAVMRYIDLFVQPNDFEEGVWLSELSDAMETSQNIRSVPVPVGQFLLINTLFWLPGRDRLTPPPDLTIQRLPRLGSFSHPASSPHTPPRPPVLHHER
uniref:carbon starvation induced protein CsiD n=1 Tax=Salmonella enterica TaxID=28901 RepID=UPI00398C8004